RQPYFQQMERFLVHETAVHWIDTFRYLMGAPDRVFADLRQMNPVIAGEDAGYILFSYPGERRAMFDGNRLLDHAARNTRCTMGEALIEGTAGTITLLGDGSVHLRRFGTLGSDELLAPAADAAFGGDCVYHLNAHVVAALRADGAEAPGGEKFVQQVLTGGCQQLDILEKQSPAARIEQHAITTDVASDARAHQPSEKACAKAVFVEAVALQPKEWVGPALGMRMQHPCRDLLSGAWLTTDDNMRRGRRRTFDCLTRHVDLIRRAQQRVSMAKRVGPGFKLMTQDRVLPTQPHAIQALCDCVQDLI
ncbi:MAG: hypothetical protein AAF899_02205, partial [Pseudomonadota bacterium]